MLCYYYYFFFFFNDTATTEIYTLSLHDALPISPRAAQVRRARHGRRRGPRGGGQCGGGRLAGRVRVEHAQLRADDVHRHHWPATGEPRRAADLRALRERPAPAGEACGLRPSGAACA